MDLTDEGIAEFAEHLVPEAFTTASTATRVEIRPAPGADWVGEWVTSCLRDAVAARDLAGDGVAGVIFVQRDNERWRWDSPHPVWPLDALVESVQAQLAEFPQPCVFLADLHDRRRQEVRARLRGHDAMPSWNLLWYAEERSQRRTEVMSGVAQINGGADPTRAVERERRAFERAAQRLLVGHRSRRRYPRR